ncbi:inactive ubiquitin carboxyl-terminal hydrolase 53 isoform X1 [Denticeps clupeoides]|uniref:USP domain-containing protein n=1 Tax=Denticeps clupeoides TaxID=299321 RepID=A0AAY4A5Z1_9TELE|nr:inactive ubiquitin carboxyl-terminal hydrolase 53-like isoform X1 [Denticeps clupeoides]XP_028832403.1 inactive ubiquitin carboxyl-terminal hydrolase 53-like isoform X1 [Denticeps clupeoides]XP_028832404.1 inactive ubiquitin carboxyl-terminal hydrolase 53-like isoform X1 [Denticeps clupeoides]XP_028832405.1 inactive ubiquitin carboxyl-terminal hydrolase 53-like isoform X1 [Denticeps clupeoides]
MAWVKLFKKQGGSLGKTYQPGSMVSLALTKGLLNEPGQNSCFLNSAVQVLWQLDIFRRSLRQLSGHFCLGDACIFCALKSIFSQFQQSRERALPSDTLRHALAETFKDEQRFQLGLMDDAAECFENILQRIHMHIVSDTTSEDCTSKSCITHQKFAMTLYEQFVCRSCGASSDPLPFTEVVHYVSTTALCQQVVHILEKSDRLRADMFGELLQAANTIGDLRNCPSNCGQSIKIRRVLMNCPEIVTIGFVWDAEQSDLTEDVIRSLGPNLNLSGLFYRVTDENAKKSDLHLVGMICYSSRHYSAFAYHSKSSKWVFFDDATVKEIGTKWKDVASKCIRGHFQPLLLFYANPDGGAISNEDAPRQTTMWSRIKSPVNGEVTVTDGPHLGSKKMDGVRDSAPLRSCQSSHKSQLQSTPNSGFSRFKGVPGSPGRFRESSREYSQRGGDSQKDSERGHRRPDTLQHRDMTYPRMSCSPLENGVRSHSDLRLRSVHGRVSSRQERTPFHPRLCPQDSHPHPNMPSGSGRRNDSREADMAHERGSGNAGKPRPAWRPVREVLNVDSVLNELERKQHGSPRCHRSFGHERAPQLEHKQKGLMTIYEDESRHDTESRSSQDSQSHVGRPKGGASAPLRGDNWTIQRTESGYESSDRLSSGSTNPDSPGVESFAGKELRPAPDGQLLSRGQVHHNRGETKNDASRSPLYHSKHLLKTQGKNSDHLVKCSPSSSRRKFRYTSSSLRKGSSDRDLISSEPRQDQLDTSLRGHCTDSPSLRHLGKVSSSECNSSDDLTNPLSEQEDSAYRSSTSEAAPAESPQPPGPGQLSSREESPLATPPARSRHITTRQGDGRMPPFKPRLLQEPCQTSPRPSNRSSTMTSSHWRLEPPVSRTPSSDVSSKSGSDQERGDSGSTDLEEKSRGTERNTSGGGATPQGSGVALTTYFSVDNCMTDMYRLKYHHQRPLLLSVPEPRAGCRGAEHREVVHSGHNDSQAPTEHSRSRPDMGYASSKPTAKWNPVTPKGLDKHGFL